MVKGWLAIHNCISQRFFSFLVLSIDLSSFSSIAGLSSRHCHFHLSLALYPVWIFLIFLFFSFLHHRYEHQILVIFSHSNSSSSFQFHQCSGSRYHTAVMHTCFGDISQTPNESRVWKSSVDTETIIIRFFYS